MIYELLDIGADHARSARELSKLLHIDPRKISQAIERERREGRPICATCDSKTPGYYIPADRDDMERYCKRLQHRAGEIFKTRKACLQTLDSLPREAKAL